MDGAGNALVVWSYNDFDGGNGKKSARFTRSTGTWGPVTTLPIGASINDGGGHELFVAANGYAFMKLNLRNQDATLHRYDPAIESRSARENEVGGPTRIAVDAKGSALLVTGPYREGDGIGAKRFDASTKTYTAPVTLDFEPSTYSSTGQQLTQTNMNLLATTADSNGSGMALWQVERRDARDNSLILRELRSARYVATTRTWVRKAIPKIRGTPATDGKMTADRFGNVTALWRQTFGGYSKVVAARYSSSSGSWSTPRVISQGSFLTRDVNLDADYNGNVIATWSQRSDSGTGSSLGKIFRTKAARFSSSTNTWGTPLTIQDANRNSYFPSLGVDNSGRGVVIWSQDTGATGSDGQPIKEIRADRVLPQ